MDEKNTNMPAAAETPENNESAPAQQEEKTFNQDEVNNIVKERLDRAKKGMPSKEEMDEFKKWQDSRKSAEQLSAEKITAAERRAEDAEAKASAAEAKVSALSKGVSPDAVDDVIALALGKVSDSVTLDAAIDAVIAKYPAFTGGEQRKPTTGAKMSGGGSSGMSDVEAAFYAKNPDLVPAQK